jgi:sugar phosphate isomerase/epimerase
MNLTNNLYVSTSCIKTDRNLEKCIKELNKKNIFNIEFSGIHNFISSDKIINILKRKKNEKSNFIFHNYFPAPKKKIVMNFISRNEKIYHITKNIILNAYKISIKCNIKFYGFHPGYLRDANINSSGFFNFIQEPQMIRGEALDLFIKRYLELNKEIKSNSFSLAIENLFPNPNKTNDSLMCSFEEIDYIFSNKNISKTNLGIVLDMGHLDISANLLGFSKYDFIKKILNKYGDRIYEVHLSANNKIIDQHKRILENSWQIKCLKKFKSRLKEIAITIESRNLNYNQINHDYKMILNKI